LANHRQIVFRQRLDACIGAGLRVHREEGFEIGFGTHAAMVIAFKILAEAVTRFARRLAATATEAGSARGGEGVGARGAVRAAAASNVNC